MSSKKLLELMGIEEINLDEMGMGEINHTRQKGT